MRRTTTFLTMLIAALALIAAPAAAQDNPYSGTVTGLATTTPNPGPGSTVTISGDGCAPGATVRILVDGTEVGTVTADAEGEFTASVVAPSTPGVTFLVNAVCGTEVLGIQLTVAGAVAPPPGAGSGGGSLPVTGSETFPLAKLGAVLLGAGGVAILAVRSQRATALRARA